MNEWEIAATVLGFALIGCAAVAVLAPPAHGLVAVQVAGVLLSTVLMLLSEGFHRQPFIDLAVVFAPLSLVGGLTFARLMEFGLEEPSLLREAGGQATSSDRGAGGPAEDPL
jgi:multisubunit Na+/H+ antiporter MnhF subunit